MPISFYDSENVVAGKTKGFPMLTTRWIVVRTKCACVWKQAELFILSFVNQRRHSVLRIENRVNKRTSYNHMHTNWLNRFRQVTFFGNNSQMFVKLPFLIWHFALIFPFPSMSLLTIVGQMCLLHWIVSKRVVKSSVKLI